MVDYVVRNTKGDGTKVIDIWRRHGMNSLLGGLNKWPKTINQRSFFTPPEEENSPSIIGSVAAGIATGLIRIPEGAASLFASLYDLTNDTDTAQEVEEWFDKNVYNKLGDHRRESRVHDRWKNNSSAGEHWCAWRYRF